MQVHSSPTQKQIASRLGVSQTLVSRALSGKAGEIGASKATVEKIRRAAAEGNYQPNATALALLGAPTRTIGVLVKAFDDPYFGKLIGAIQSLAMERGHSLLLTGGRKADFAGLQKHRVDGVVLLGSDFQPEGLPAFARSGMPVVQIGTGAPFSGAAQIHMDEEAGIAELVAYLAGLGHREIGFVARETGANQRRGEILCRTLRASGLSCRAKSFLSLDGDSGPGSAVRALTGRAGMPTAVIAAEDSIALSLLLGLHEEGLRVPQDLSIAGIDDISASAQCIPPLTTLRQPVSEMAAAAFQALTLSSRKTASIPGKLIVRKSCAPLPSH